MVVPVAPTCSCRSRPTRPPTLTVTACCRVAKPETSAVTVYSAGCRLVTVYDPLELVVMVRTEPVVEPFTVIFAFGTTAPVGSVRSEEHTSELQSPCNL